MRGILKVPFVDVFSPLSACVLDDECIFAQASEIDCDNSFRLYKGFKKIKLSKRGHLCGVVCFLYLGGEIIDLLTSFPFFDRGANSANVLNDCNTSASVPRMTKVAMAKALGSQASTSGPLVYTGTSWKRSKVCRSSSARVTGTPSQKHNAIIQLASRFSMVSR
jgi:hypothetical protein